MANQQGNFIWYELMTPDADGAQSFYGKLLGWNFQDSGQQHIDYRVFSAGEHAIGGAMQLSDEMKENGKISAVDEILIKRLLHKQSKIRDLFKKILESTQGQPAEEGSDE